jgi:hypothetical protein
LLSKVREARPVMLKEKATWKQFVPALKFIDQIAMITPPP